MNLHEWLNYIGSIHRTEIDLGLERITQVANTLGIVSFACPVVTVAGTNGKGSCVTAIDAIVRQAGYAVASYTSPHLCHFNERIQIGGEPVADETICHAFAQIETARAKTSLTFFEFITLAALLIFKQHKLDLIILEVGLGGRLDAVNIIDADIAVITTIALDHTDRLGDSREQIGFEKAGIMRKGKKAICGDYHPPASIQSVVDRLSLKLAAIGRDFDYSYTGQTWAWHNPQITYSDLPIPNLELQNVATALQAVALLNTSLTITEQAIKAALQDLSLLGRFYHLVDDKLAITLDVAHNPAGGEWLAMKLKQQPLKGRLFAVVGMLSDKDQQGTLAPLVAMIDQWFIASLAVPRGGSVGLLEQSLQQLGAHHLSCYPTVIQAYQAAKLRASVNDRIVVFGSFHTVGAVLGAVRGGN